MDITPGAGPDAQASRFKSQSEAEKRRLEKKKVKAPEVEIEQAKSAPTPSGGPSFVMRNVKVTGSSVFIEKDLRPIYESYINKDVTFADLEKFVNAIKAKYNEKGYLTTLVFIPEQDIKEGVIEIRVQEGRVGAVTVEGNKWFPSAQIKRYINLKKNEPLNVLTLQKLLLRLNQNSDIEVRSIVSPGKEPGTSDIVLKVKDKFPYHAGTSLDNQGTRIVGKYRDSFSFRSTDLTGHNDSFFLTTLISAMSSGTFLSYVLPIDIMGTKIGMDVTAFKSKLGQEYKAFDITGDTQIYTPHVGGDIYLSEDFQATVDGGFDIKSIRKAIQGEKSTDDQLRIPYMSFDITKMDSILGGGQTSFSPRFDFLTNDFLGASSRYRNGASRPGAGGFYFKYEQGLRRYQRMPFDSYLLVRSQFQVTSRTLPSSEQIQFGGANTIRGYPEGEYLADCGGYVNIDWFFPLYLIPKDYRLPCAEMPLRNQIQPVVFFDFGGGKILKPAPWEKKERFLMGAGGGVRIQFNRNLFATIEWAQHIGGDRPTPGQGPSNFHLAFQFEV